MCAMFLLYNRLDFGTKKNADAYKTFSITIPEDLDYSGVFDDIFAEYTVSHDLARVKSTNMGSMFKLTYNVVLRDASREKEMIDKIRCRNGNLEITVSKQETTVTIKVTADDKTVTFTLNTDKIDLADAMLAEELCAGEEGAYGLYIKYVNGIRADYDLDGGYYWNLTVDGEVSMIGASGTPVIHGSVYEFVRTK